ncbi:MAG: hypothetical protein EOM24_05435 [Chloroflexia bacterium]|nr:hypothetical protein [Chloroflexia bacterium]
MIIESGLYTATATFSKEVVPVIDNTVLLSTSLSIGEIVINGTANTIAQLTRSKDITKLIAINLLNIHYTPIMICYSAALIALALLCCSALERLSLLNVTGETHAYD